MRSHHSNLTKNKIKLNERKINDFYCCIRDQRLQGQPLPPNLERWMHIESHSFSLLLCSSVCWSISWENRWIQSLGWTTGEWGWASLKKSWWWKLNGPPYFYGFTSGNPTRFSGNPTRFSWRTDKRERSLHRESSTSESIREIMDNFPVLFCPSKPGVYRSGLWLNQAFQVLFR